MTRTEIITFEYESCGECPNVEDLNDGWKCLLKRKKKIPELWGEIPKWCPLPEKS